MFRERIIPRAVLYFTGEAGDDDFDDEEDEDDEDEDGDRVSGVFPLIFHLLTDCLCHVILSRCYGALFRLVVWGRKFWVHDNPNVCGQFAALSWLGWQILVTQWRL